MSDERQSIDQWDTCSPGELTKLVHRLDARQRSARRKQVLNTALVSTCVFACVVLALGSFVNRGGTHYGGIACSVCRDHLTDYQLHLIGESTFDDAELLTSMKTHLEKCKFCRGKFNTLYPEQRISNSITKRRAILIALQPNFSVGQQLSLY